MMADLPSVVFISCSDVDPDDIIKLILNKSELPEKVPIDEGIYGFPWNIDSKYYTADVKLCSLKRKSLCNEKFSDSVQAVVIHFDSSKKHALEDIDTWLPFINEFAPEIKILVCKNIRNEDENCTGTCKLTAQEWCIKRGYELVELEPLSEDKENVDGDDELEDDFKETTGINRVIQALYAHVWPNLVMKSCGQKVNTSKNSVDSVNENKCGLKELGERLSLEESLEELLENDDDFSHLFSQLPEMKARISALSGSDRKEAAEQVVKAFWKCLGGDSDDEFLDL